MQWYASRLLEPEMPKLTYVARVGYAELASAVSNAGGLGIVPLLTIRI